MCHSKLIPRDAEGPVKDAKNVDVSVVFHVMRRRSPTEWSGSSNVADRESWNTGTASSKVTPCLLRLRSAFARSDSKCIRDAMAICRRLTSQFWRCEEGATKQRGCESVVQEPAVRSHLLLTLRTPAAASSRT